MKKRLTCIFNSHGETIVETLAAILIAALSCTILMTTVVAASRINLRAKAMQTQFQTELLAAEIGTGETQAGMSETVSIEVKTSAGTTLDTITCDVIYTGGKGKLTSYRLDQEGDGT